MKICIGKVVSYILDGYKDNQKLDLFSSKFLLTSFYVLAT